MYSKEDWDAAISSEVFRIYLESELKKMASKKNEVEIKKIAEDDELIVSDEEI